MQEKIGERDVKRQPLNIVTNACGKVDNVCKVPQKRRSTSRSVPVEQHVQCVVVVVVKARNMVEDRQAEYCKGELAVPDTCESQSTSEYSQDNYSVDDNDHTVACDARPTRLLTGGDALRMEFLQFCVKHGIERRERYPWKR